MSRPSAGSLVAVTLSALAAVAAAALLVGSLAAPELTERIVGNAKVGAESVISHVIGTTPTITLGGEGGEAELDHCTGEFIELVSYRIDGVLPVYAAHNNCGGDIILAWPMGQVVRVEGSDVLYEVVDERHTRRDASVSDLIGMRGEFVVQTCYYGENRMRFLGLAPVGGVDAPTS